MNDVGQSLADGLTRMLDPNERDAVCGDLAESGATGKEAFCEVLGLVVRRQAALWTSGRPWLVLAGVIVPLGTLLSVRARLVADNSSIYLWMYLNNWHWSYLEARGFWYVLSEVAPSLLLVQLNLACLSWTAGVVLGFLSRRLIVINGLLLSFMLLLGELAAVPLIQEFVLRFYQRLLHAPATIDPNAAVFALSFYHVVFPIIVLVVFVVLPALWGMGEGPRITAIRPGIRKILWLCAVVSLGVMLMEQPGVLLFLFLGFHRPAQLLTHRAMQVFQIAVYWPVAYLVAVKLGRRFRQSRLASA